MERVNATRRSPARDAAAARVRAAIAAAGEERLALLTRPNASLLEARAQGRTLRALAAEIGVSAQGLQYRERMALRALARDS